MDIKALSRTYLFEGLNIKELKMLLVTAGEISCSKNDIVFSEGDKGNKIFMVSQGVIEIWKKQGNELRGNRLAKLRDGELFGEMSIFDKQPRSASAIATGHKMTKILVWGEQDMTGLIKEYPALGTKILANVVRKLSGHLRNANTAVQNLRKTFLPVYG